MRDIDRLLRGMKRQWVIWGCLCAVMAVSVTIDVVTLIVHPGDTVVTCVVKPSNFHVADCVAVKR